VLCRECIFMYNADEFSIRVNFELLRAHFLFARVQYGQ
jgi:hypothetical protein